MGASCREACCWPLLAHKFKPRTSQVPIRVNQLLLGSRLPAHLVSGGRHRGRGGGERGLRLSIVDILAAAEKA